MSFQKCPKKSQIANPGCDDARKFVEECNEDTKAMEKYLVSMAGKV